MVLTLIVTKVNAGGNRENEPESMLKTASVESSQAVPFGLSIKLLPALYWGALGVQAEYPVTEKISVGLMIMAKKTDSKSYTIQPEDYQNAGFAVDLIGKYYFIGSAPQGLYGMANLSYNSMLFFDGNTRPYTLHNRWKKFEGFRVPNSIEAPKAFNMGLGVGYQLVIIPQHIIADVYLSASGNFDSDNSFFIQLYLAPSIGFVF